MPQYFRVKTSGSPGGGPGAWLTPLPVPFQDFVVGQDKLSAEAAASLGIPRSEAARLDFSFPVYEVIATLHRERFTTVANWRHTSGEIVARFVHSRTVVTQPPAESTSLIFVSEFEDGRRLVTTSDSPPPAGPPNTTSQGFAGLGFGELLAKHRQKLDELRGTTPVRKLANDDAMALLCDRIEIECLEPYVRNGLFEMVSAAEVSAQPPPAEPPPLPEIAPEDAAVLAEIDRRQNKPFNLTGAIALAVVSLAAFVAIGGAQWDWEFAIILAGLLVFHEMGHFIAMHIFKYKNVRMFFIPLAGGAVTGRHYNAQGWQKAVVYLAGPVPGIIAGLILLRGHNGVFLFGPSEHYLLMRKIALLSLLFNGVNLAPVLPLDGGGIMHAVLFCRHFVLETVFMGFAGVALFAAGIMDYGRIWLYLGLLTLIGLPASFRLAKIAARLKTQGLSAASPDNQSIPPETTLAILRELRQNQRVSRTAKQQASEVITVFEKLNSRPPGALASAFLLAIYFGVAAAAFQGLKPVIWHRNRIFSETAPASAGLQMAQNYPVNSTKPTDSHESTH